MSTPSRAPDAGVGSALSGAASASSAVSARPSAHPRTQRRAKPGEVRFRRVTSGGGLIRVLLEEDGGAEDELHVVVGAPGVVGAGLEAVVTDLPAHGETLGEEQRGAGAEVG